MTQQYRRESYRVEISGDRGQLAGIIDRPTSQPLAHLIFSHCFTCGKDLKMIVRLSRLLAEQGLLVLRFDMSGIGNSEGDFSETNFRTNLSDIRAAHRFLATEHQAPEFLIGHSFGGAASLAVSQELHSVIGTITIAAPSDTHHLADVLSNMNPSIEESGIGDVQIGGRTFTIREQMLRDFRSFDLASTLAKIAKPILAFHSPIDKTVAYRHAIQIVVGSVERQPGRGSRTRSLITLPGADHLLTNAANIPYVANIIALWTRQTQLS